MKYALIGCGRIAANHIAAAVNNHLDITALSDIHVGRAHDLACKFSLNEKDTVIYTDYKKMLEEQQPQLAAIATESGKHAQIALDCIDFGCNDYRKADCTFNGRC